MRALLALCSLIAFAAPAGAMNAFGPLPPYSKRLDLARSVALRYPGPTRLQDPLGRYGLWAGILVQTDWQQRTHRDRIPLWSLLNETLSVEPSMYAAELEQDRRGRDALSLCASSPHTRALSEPTGPGPAIDAHDVCGAWMRYLLAAGDGLSPRELQKLLWHAHTMALVYGLRVHAAALAAVRVPAAERNFWSSWLEIVLVLEALDWPTDGGTTVPASDRLMPPCAPLGAPGCPLTRSALGKRVAFVSALASRPASLDRIYRLYGALHAGSHVLAPLALVDSSLAKAIGEYLRAGSG